MLDCNCGSDCCLGKCIKNNLGILMGGLLIGLSSIISLLSFLNDCKSDNNERNENIQKALSVSLVLFSLSSSVFERQINKKLIKVEIENEDLKTELGKSKKETNSSNNSVVDINEPYQTPENQYYYQPNQTNKSSESFYPNALKFNN